MKLAGLLLLATGAYAQTASLVNILADDSQVLVGRTLQMRAVVRDNAGNPIPNAPVTWAVNQAAVSISASGLVTAKGLATVRVTARSGNATGEAAIQTIPSRMEVTPSTAELSVGQQMRFQAAVYDADSKPIPGVTFAWSLTNDRQGASSLGRIDNTGMVTPTGEGGVFVFATYNYNEIFPGLQRQWIAYSKVTVSVPKTYELHKIYSTLSQARSSWSLRARQSMIWSTDDGELFFNASLGGLANGLVSWKDGNYRLVSAGGVPRFGRGATALDFRIHSITHDGQVLTYEDTNINGAELNLGNHDGVAPFLNNNVPLGATEATSGLSITRNSYTSTGWAMVRGSFRFPNETVTNTGVFRGQGTVAELLVSTADTLPEMPGVFTIDGDFGIAADGTAFYSVTSGTVRAFYRHDFNGRQKLIAVGDAILGSKVRQFAGGRTNSPSVWFDEDGTALVTALLEDGSLQILSFAPDGKMTSQRVNSQSGILWRNAAQGALLYANPYNNRGNGIYLWKGATVDPVYVLGKKLWNQTILEIESGTVNTAGQITLMLRGSETPLIVARMDAEPYVLFVAGDTVKMDLPVNVFTLIGGARVGPPHVQAGGNSGSIAGFNNGDWELTLGIGERLFGNTMWFGGSHGATYNMRKAPNGDIYFTNSAGIARIVPGGAPELVVPFPLKIDNTLTLNAPGQIDINGQGAILFQSSTSLGDNRMFIWQGGQAKQLLVLSTTAATATVLDGRTASSFDSFGIDDTGRVIAVLRFRGLAVPILGVWDGASWTMAAVPNQTRIGNALVTGVPNFAKAVGTRLIAGLTVAPGLNLVAEWKPSGFAPLVNVDTIMPNGQNANSIAALDVNLRGDLLFQFSNGVNSMVVNRGGRLQQVHDFFKPTADGDWLIRINAMDLRDDGTVYFLAVTATDEVVLYQATPIG